MASLLARLAAIASRRVRWAIMPLVEMSRVPYTGRLPKGHMATGPHLNGLDAFGHRVLELREAGTDELGRDAVDLGVLRVVLHQALEVGVVSVLGEDAHGRSVRGQGELAGRGL